MDRVGSGEHVGKTGASPDWKRVVLRGVVAVAVLAYVGQFFTGPGLLDEGEPAPTFQAELDNNHKLNLQGGPGQPLVLTFWASWCGPCRQEAPILSALHDRGILVVGISLDDVPKAKASAAARAIGMAFPIIAERPDLAHLYRVQAVPTTYVVAPDGTIVLARSGVVSGAQLDEAVAKANAFEI